jgi:hypothetical protein
MAVASDRLGRESPPRRAAWRLSDPFNAIA